MALGDEMLDGFDPTHGTGDLGGQGRADFIHRGNGACGEIRHHGDGWCGNGGSGELGGEFFLGGGHQAGVVGACDVELNRAADAEVLGLRHGGIDIRAGSGKHDLAGGVKVRNIDIRGGGELSDFFLLTTDQSGHGSIGRLAGFLHESAALGDELQAVDERESPGGRVGGEFAERETGGGGGLEVWQSLFQQGEPDQAVEVKGGLAARGGGQAFLRTIEHDRCKGVAERFIGLAGESAGGRGGLDPIAGHAGFLSALSGEEDNGLGHGRF